MDIRTQLINDIKEQDYKRLTEKFKRESIAEWDCFDGDYPVFFPAFLLAQIHQKWQRHLLLN